jgi:hypothetical protein
LAGFDFAVVTLVLPCLYKLHCFLKSSVAITTFSQS